MHQADGRVVSNFVMQALLDKPITLYGTGKQTRSFCYVDDLIEGLVRLMESPSDFIGPVNLGNPDEFSIKELALEILGQTKSQSELHFLPLPADDPKQRRPDITLAKSILNWQPVVPLAEGLQPTIEHFTSLIRNISAQTSAASKLR
jgi:UDP-glucuronate decarboxylase